VVIKSRSIATFFKTSSATLLMCSVPFLAAAQSSSNEAAYSALLVEIENAKLVLAQKQAFVATQQAEIDSLRAQIKGVGGVSSSVGPMIDKMAAAIDVEINKDIPFNAAERFARLGALKDLLAKPGVKPGEKISRLYNIYDIEVSYGNSVEAYDGESPVNPGGRMAACVADLESEACGLSKEQKKWLDSGDKELRDLRDELPDGSYLRYGRVALSYLERDDSVALRYDPKSKEWVELSAAQALELRRGVRTARGEAAPTVVMAPVYKVN